MQEALVLLVFVGAGCACAAKSSIRLEAPSFTQGVVDYMALRRAAVSDVGRVEVAASARRVVAEVDELANAIRSRRHRAVEGDLFLPHVTASFRTVISDRLREDDGAQIARRIANPNPVSPELHVNDRYPADQPRASMPNAILRLLPRLPEELEYRFVGRDLVLLDRNVSLVVGVARDVIRDLPPADLQ